MREEYLLGRLSLIRTETKYDPLVSLKGVGRFEVFSLEFLRTAQN